MRELLLRVLNTLEQEGIRYCLLRNGHELDELAHGSDVDLLIGSGQASRLEAVLPPLGFVRLPAWGRRPHRFFVAYHQPSHSWLKLDAVTRLPFGRSNNALCRELTAGCLARRLRHGPAFIPSAEDELIALLLHCVIDKERFTDSHRRRARQLRHQIGDESYLAGLLSRCWPPAVDWSVIAAWIDSENWPALLAHRQCISAALGRRSGPSETARRGWNRVLRKLQRLTGLGQPRMPLVAVLAPDGAGKTTLIRAIEKSFYFSTRAIYMGLYPKRNRTRNRPWLPGVGLAIRLMKQRWLYLTARYHRCRGQLILFDRYGYDAWLPMAEGPPMAGGPNVLSRWRRRLLANACPAPDLVIVLDAPGEVLFARKGEHTAAVLENQRRGYLALRRRVPRMVVVDATRDPGTVCRRTTAAIWQNAVVPSLGLCNSPLPGDLSSSPLPLGEGPGVRASDVKIRSELPSPGGCATALSQRERGRSVLFP